ncbi:MAG: hypothetical protein V1721_00005 [Pseudomonadota bacterium]
MVKIHKFIFRVDFDVSYEMLDQRGKVLKILVDAEKWSTVGELVGQRTLKAILKDEKEYRYFIVDPVTINGV